MKDFSLFNRYILVGVLLESILIKRDTRGILIFLNLSGVEVIKLWPMKDLKLILFIEFF